MITMEVEGINWVGNIYQKFENMCLEAEEMMYEDTVKYLENQVQTVGASVKKFYSDVLQDFLPPSSCDLDENVVSELPIDQDTDVEVHKKSFLGSTERPAKVDIKQTNRDLRINHDVDNNLICAASFDESCDTNVLLTSASGNAIKGNKFDLHARKHVGTGSTHIKSNNLSINENRKNKKMLPTKTSCKITSTETEPCRISSCEVLNGNHKVPCHHLATVSNPASAEVTRPNLVADCCNEIENASDEQIPNVPIFFKATKEKEMNMSPPSSDVLSGEPNGFSMERVIQSDDCSYSTVILSHPDAWNFDETVIDTVTEKGHEIMQQDDELKLEETCVMVSGDELRLVPKAGGNLRTNKKKMRQAFTLRKKSARKQEYEQLAVWHGNSDKGKGDCVENSVPTHALGDHKKLLLANIPEPEWELL